MTSTPSRKARQYRYKGYIIRQTLFKSWDFVEGWNAFYTWNPERPIFPVDLPTFTRTKLAINLKLIWQYDVRRYNPTLFNKYYHMLLVNRFNYSKCWGKIIPIWKIREVIRARA